MMVVWCIRFAYILSRIKTVFFTDYCINTNKPLQKLIIVFYFGIFIKNKYPYVIIKQVLP